MSELQPRSDREQRFMDALVPVQAGVERYALSLVRDRDDAKDLMQETVAIVWRKFDSIADPAAFKSYLLTIMTNLHRRRYRRGKIFRPLTEIDTEYLADNSPLPDRTAEMGIVKDALLRLSPKAREAIILYEIEDMKVADIAKIQRSTVSAVKVRLMRARARLAKILDVEQKVTNPTPSIES